MRSVDSWRTTSWTLVIALAALMALGACGTPDGSRPGREAVAGAIEGESAGVVEGEAAEVMEGEAAEVMEGEAAAAATTAPLGETPSHVRATVQRRPGGPHEEMDMAVHAAPTDLATLAADEVDLDGDELVLGVVVEGQPVAYPVRYLALSEVVNDRVAETSIAPSW